MGVGDSGLGTIGGRRGGAATRGHEPTLRGAGVIPAHGAGLVGLMPVRIAEITGATEESTNFWSYQWQEVALETPPDFGAPTGALTHSDLGLAYNLAEFPNSGSGVQGNGIDIDGLPGDFAIQRIPDGTPVFLLGPTGPLDDPFMLILAPWVNTVDGSCSA